MHVNQWWFALNTFRTLEGKEKKVKDAKEIENLQQTVQTYSETNIYLVESNFVNNFKVVFGEDCPFFGKMLYLYMARGYDRSKISLLRFVECLFPLFNNDNR
mmetsp:Transcript_9887/g.14961  ORF Transcript_9887/g.14961 Transcript_9887/m.14961 type:complete len:102 (+) Transcript_9887:376-681(+)